MSKKKKKAAYVYVEDDLSKHYGFPPIKLTKKELEEIKRKKEEDVDCFSIPIV